jgi:hypothetical protein
VPHQPTLTEIQGWQVRAREVSGEGLTEADGIDQITALEELKSAAAAAQAHRDPRHDQPDRPSLSQSGAFTTGRARPDHPTATAPVRRLSPPPAPPPASGSG